VNLADILAACGELSQPSSIADNGAHEGYRRAVIVNGGHYYIPELADVLADLEPIRGCWLSWIDPGGHIVEHIDSGPYFERWQIPLTEAGTLYQGGVAVDHVVGVPFRVAHHEWHSVTNDSDQPRVSLVVDRDIPAGVPSAPFRLKEPTWPTSN
jgi:hypothetical protein